MRKRFTYILMVVVSSLILFTSCEEQISWELDSESVNTVVVDGRLTNEVKFQHIHLTKPMQDVNGEPVPVTGAFVIVTTDNQPYLFVESTEEPGHYYTQNQIAASVSEVYHLKIEHEGKTFRAETYMIPVSSANLPGWQYDEESELYKIIWPQGTYDPFEQAMYEATISWKHLLGNAFPDSVAMAKIMHYTFNTIDVSYVILPQDMEEVLFPKNSIAVVKKYSLTDEYAAYLRALIAETEWQGSLFEEARGNLPTNITNGGLGYFSACSVAVDTVFVN